MSYLAGLRVLAIEQFGAGPWATMQLADLGADVIKIEDPASGGDVGRYVPPFQSGSDSLFFETFNRNKRSVLLDLRSAEGRASFEELVRTTDAVFSNLRGDQPEKLRIRFDDLKHLNPAIVCVSLSGFGTSGPRRGEGAYDHTIQGLAGWMSVTGGPDQPPTKSGLSLVDFCGGYVAALGILAGVTEARATGAGSDVDVSLFETALHVLTYLGTWSASRDWKPVRMADSAHQSMVPFQTFEAADGMLVIACPKQSLWLKLCDALGHPEWKDDERFADFAARQGHRAEAVTAINEALSHRTVADWSVELTRLGIPCGPVNDLAAALADPQVAARNTIVGYDHPELGAVRQIASPIRRPGRELPVERAPRLGEHTESILGSLPHDD